MRKSISAVEKQISFVEKNLHQSRIDLENLKSIQEEKEETLRVMAGAVKEEEKKLDRAKVKIKRNFTIAFSFLECIRKTQGRNQGRRDINN